MKSFEDCEGAQDFVDDHKATQDKLTLTIELPEDKLRTLAKEIMECYPEFSSGNCLQCVAYNYKAGKFTFVDTETDKEYAVKTDDIFNVLPKFIDGIIKSKWKFYGLTSENILAFDAGNYDAYAADALVQLATLGDIIYG
jgi:hypothetical protein